MLLAGAVLALMLGAWREGRPVELAHSLDQRLPCVSYAPFRRAGHTPFDAALRVSPAQIEADLRLLATVSSCVRTYGLDHGLDAVPGIARQLGLRVVLGAWIGRDPVANTAQLDAALALSRAYPDVVVLLVVGNEVLLRRELEPAALAALLARARRETTVPVSYADVWEFWLRHAAVLRPHVDVVAAHVLPYWEDEPVAAEDAVDHVLQVAAHVQAALAPLPVFIAETGWPAYGRQRGAARPGGVEQAAVIRALLARDNPRSDSIRWPAWNLIEGFDQPWKRALEGAVGGYWGLFDADGYPRVRLTGPVVADISWWQVPLAALAGALGGALWAWRQRMALGAESGTGKGTGAGRAALVLAGAGVGALALLQWRMLLVVCRDGVDWLVASALCLTALLCALAAAAQLARRLGTAKPPTRRPGLYALVRGAPARGLGWLVVGQAGLLFSMAVLALALVFDGRYRPLIWPIFAAPVVLLAVLAWLGERLAADAREERLLALTSVLLAPVLLWQEGVVNGQAWGAALGCLMLVAVIWPAGEPHGDASGDRAVPGRTQANAPSNTAGAHSPAE